MTQTSRATRADGLYQEVAEQLLERARAEGEPGRAGRPVVAVTKPVLETASDAELTEHRGYEPHERVGADNSRNGYRAPDRAHRRGLGGGQRAAGPGGSFEPKLVHKRQRRLTGRDVLIGPVEGARQAGDVW